MTKSEKIRYSEWVKIALKDLEKITYWTTKNEHGFAPIDAMEKLYRELVLLKKN